MPAQKRSSNQRKNNEEPYPQHRRRRKQSREGSSAVDQLPTSSSSTLPQSSPQQQQVHQPNEEQQEDQPAVPVCDQDPVEETQQDDSDGSGTDPEEFDEIITVLRSELRNNVQCPICLGIIKKTRTVMGCLHRFCRECIDKSMRLGNKECPACRIHCASRRSLRDDQDFDRLIKAIYPDAVKYEEKELMFCEEDKTRNEQIQASIEQISRRQSEAVNKKRKSGKEVDDSLPRTCYNSYSRRRKKNPKFEVEEFDENENDGRENPSSSGNHGTEIKHKKRKKRRIETQQQMSEEMCISLKAVRKTENLTWGRGGARSSRLSRGSPLFKLIDCIESVTITETEPHVQSLTTTSENESKMSSEKPIVSSHTRLSVDEVLEPKQEAYETKAPAEVVEPVPAKYMRTLNESAAKSETSVDVPNSSSPNVTQLDVGPESLDRKENPVEVSYLPFGQ